MKIKLLRASTTAKEVEFAATMPPLDIQRLSVARMIRAVHVTKFKSSQTTEAC